MSTLADQIGKSSAGHYSDFVALCRELPPFSPTSAQMNHMLAEIEAIFDGREFSKWPVPYRGWSLWSHYAQQGEWA